jgi:hypothetical protein
MSDKRARPRRTGADPVDPGDPHAIAKRLVAQLGPRRALHLAAWIDEVAQEAGGSGADVRTAQLVEGGDAA